MLGHLELVYPNLGVGSLKISMFFPQTGIVMSKIYLNGTPRRWDGYSFSTSTHEIGGGCDTRCKRVFVQHSTAR